MTMIDDGARPADGTTTDTVSIDRGGPTARRPASTADLPPPPAAGTYAVSPTDLVVLGRVASKAQLVRDAARGRDEAIAEAVTDEGIDVAAVAHAAGLTPAEVATIVFVQEANPSPFMRLRRNVRRRQAS